MNITVIFASRFQSSTNMTGSPWLHHISKLHHLQPIQFSRMLRALLEGRRVPFRSSICRNYNLPFKTQGTAAHATYSTRNWTISYGPQPQSYPIHCANPAAESPMPRAAAFSSSDKAWWVPFFGLATVTGHMSWMCHMSHVTVQNKIYQR